MSNKSGTSDDIISLPSGGGALEGIGETFSPDLFTGTGNFSVPISVPKGRGEYQPSLSLVYSTGNGNGPFGLGWSLSVPGVRRKTSKGVPRFIDKEPEADPDDKRSKPNPDVFVLSGAEDLVQVADDGGVTSYRPRTEGLFARIEHHAGGDDDYWEVRSKNGNISLYGTPFDDWPGARDPATLADPEDASRITAWRLRETRDPFGNLIRYTYDHDTVDGEFRSWEQIYLEKIEYVDYGEQADPDFLIRVEFEYEERPDPFSGFRGGFEVRTTRRCTGIKIFSNEVGAAPIREYELIYAPDDELHNGMSVLKQIIVTGHDDSEAESLPPLEFTYSDFEPEERKFDVVGGKYVPGVPLSHPTIETVDLNGNGLPDLVELSGNVARFWENMGDGEFSNPRQLRETPMGLSLADEGVRFIDAQGDGRPDLMVTRPENGLAGYFPKSFERGWEGRSFQPYEVLPPFRFTDPNVALIDLTGDGLTDVLRTGRTFECYFNDEDNRQAWKNPRHVTRQDAKAFPNVDVANPRVKTADMTGDGLQDIVLVHSGRVDYWPNMGHGEFGPRITMQNAPTLPQGYRPEMVLLGDADGSGCADLIYVDNKGVHLAMNKSGNGFADSIRIKGTPLISDVDSLRLVDLYGTGTPGLLWTQYQRFPGGPSMYFLDLTGGEKPYLLTEMDNHMGSVTRVGYEPSTKHFLRDHRKKETRWQTPLPFPVQTVTRVEVIDQVSKGKMTTEYSYRHGYWDGHEREFRGFGHVIQRDTESFDDYNGDGFFPGEEFENVGSENFSPPIETKHWFQLGPIHDPAGGFRRADFTDEYTAPEIEVVGEDNLFGEVSMLTPWDELDETLSSFSVAKRRDALRTLRGSTLRTELYSRDGTQLEDLPFVITEAIQDVREEETGVSGGEQKSIFFPFGTASRTTNWERGEDPATTFEFSADYNAYGQPERSWSIASPRGWEGLDDVIDPSSDPFLSVHQKSEFIHVDVAGGQYMVDRVSKSESHEVVQEEDLTVVQLVAEINQEGDQTVSWSLQGLQRMYYDGSAYVGEALGVLGDYGALTRSEKLVMTGDILADAYPSGTEEPDNGVPVYLSGDTPNWPSEYPDEFKTRIDGLDGRAGYTYEGGVDGYFFVNTSRVKYDFHDDPGGEGRGMMLATKDPIGNVTQVSWDTFELLPIEVTDPEGMKTRATCDYRTFKPEEVEDPNGNRTQFAYSPLGLVLKTAVMGKDTETVGDTLTDPGTSFEYDFTAFDTSGSPVSVTTTQRVYHVNDGDIPTGADEDETIVSVEYSDGFGRVIQTRSQAEDLNFGDAGLTMSSVDDAEGTTTTEQRVRVSGWQRYDNKGEVVEKWEPFFSEGFDFEDVSQSPDGQSIEMFYDALHRPLRTVQPNGAEERIIYGIPHFYIDYDPQDPPPHNPDDFEPTPWEVYTYDGNDNGGRTSIDGITESDFDDHHDTPSSVVKDALGRDVETVQRNHKTDPQEWYSTKVEYDIRGNVLSITDPLDRVAATKIYDLADRPLRATSIDAGTSIIVHDAAGTPVESRDARGAWELTRVDDLLRPTHMWGQDATGEDLRLVQHIVYGDDAGLTDPEDDNLLGKPYIHRDEAGRLEFESYSFKGELLEKVREVIDPQHVIDTYNAANPDVDTFRVDWTPDTGETFGDREGDLLDGSFNYRVSTTYDALGRAKKVTYPEDVANERKELTPTYNKAGALQSVDLNGSTYVNHIAYNPRGQRILAAFGNDVMTRYAYDDKTFRLVRLRSEPYIYDDTTETYSSDPNGARLQDVRYTYDAVGNVLTQDNRGSGVGIDLDNYGHAEGGDWGEFDADSLIRLFSYDPLYRLTKASGREHNQSAAVPWGDNVPGGTDFNDARPYLESYEYDEVGSVTKKTHEYANASSGTDSWVRDFGIESGSNRIDAIRLVQDQYNYSYDAGGNLIQENTERHYEWDHTGSMKEFRVQTSGSAPSKYGHYSYDAGGQRVLKVNIQSSDPVSTVYIDGIFEHHRIHDGSGNEPENNTLYVMDDASRVATHRVGTDIFNTSKPATLYHLGDHLGSSNVLVDDQGTFINREEFRPYGETAFGSYAKKRYRFTGKERDEESGLYYHGARYYAPWLARWTAPDPAGMVDGVNLYAYVRGNPVRLVDPDGRQSDEVDESTVHDDSNQDGERLRIGNAISRAKHHLLPTGHEGGVDPALSAAEEAAEREGNLETKPSTTLGELHQLHEIPSLANIRREMGDQFDNTVVRVATDEEAQSLEEKGFDAEHQPNSNEIVLTEDVYYKVVFSNNVDDMGERAVKAIAHEVGHALLTFRDLKAVDFDFANGNRSRVLTEIAYDKLTELGSDDDFLEYLYGREVDVQEIAERAWTEVKWEIGALESGESRVFIRALGNQYRERAESWFEQKRGTYENAYEDYPQEIREAARLSGIR